jgi:predicted transcriptional regulator YdeE
MKKTERIFALIKIIYEKKQFTVDELAQYFQVSYRTMLRDLQELSGLGIPLYSQTGRRGGYSILDGHTGAAASASPQLVHRSFKPVTLIVGMEMKVPFTAVTISNTILPSLWEQFLFRVAEIPHRIDSRMLTGAVRSRGAIYHYVAGAEVHALSEIPEGMVSLTLPQRPYAVYRHHGRLQREARDETYFQALERLRRQNIDHDPDAYCLETFRYEEKQPGGFGDCHIWIPLK